MTEHRWGLRETARSLGLMKETAMDDARGMGRSGAAMLRGVLVRPAVWLGVALGVLGFADLGSFEPSAAPTWILPLLALSYLVFGAARGQLRRPGVLGVLRPPPREGERGGDSRLGVRAFGRRLHALERLREPGGRRGGGGAPAEVLRLSAPSRVDARREIIS